MNIRKLFGNHLNKTQFNVKTNLFNFNDFILVYNNYSYFNITYCLHYYVKRSLNKRKYQRPIFTFIYILNNKRVKKLCGLLLNF
jgi:hypothetical protein